MPRYNYFTKQKQQWPIGASNWKYSTNQAS